MIFKQVIPVMGDQFRFKAHILWELTHLDQQTFAHISGANSGRLHTLHHPQGFLQMLGLEIVLVFIEQLFQPDC